MNAAQWFINHYRRRASIAGVFVVARQLKKQGVPLAVALAILCGRQS
jgi:hypothetical protein